MEIDMNAVAAAAAATLAADPNFQQQLRREMVAQLMPHIRPSPEDQNALLEGAREAVRERLALHTSDVVARVGQSLDQAGAKMEAEFKLNLGSRVKVNWNELTSPRKIEEITNEMVRQEVRATIGDQIAKLTGDVVAVLAARRNEKLGV